MIPVGAKISTLTTSETEIKNLTNQILYLIHFIFKEKVSRYKTVYIDFNSRLDMQF